MTYQEPYDVALPMIMSYNTRMPISEKVHPFSSALTPFQEREKRPEGPHFLHTNPDFVVKIEPDEHIYTLAECKNSVVLFKEIRNNWGINVVDIGYFIGPAKLPPPPAYEMLGDLNSINIYRITDRISGDNLENTLPPIDMVDSLYGALTDYFSHKLDADEGYLGDIISPSQYVYGTKKGDESPSIYLVDVDYYAAHTKHQDKEIADEDFLRYFWTLSETVTKLEIRYQEKLPARKKLLSLLESMQESGRFDDDKRGIAPRLLKFSLAILRAKPDRVDGIVGRYDSFEERNM